jgi:transposase-like protein
MAGRPLKVYSLIYREIFMELQDKTRILIGKIPILCPICGSHLIGNAGKRKRQKGEIEEFQCRNPNCPFLKKHKQGKQFQSTTSKIFLNEVTIKLQKLYTDLYEGAKNRTVAKKYNISPSEVSILRNDFQDALQDKKKLKKLVSCKQDDSAIAIDETFFKIDGKSIYVILATGYNSHKTLGILVSTSRSEEDIQKVFDEAQKNTKKPIQTITLDAWGATIKMAKNLRRKITLIIHKHKSPYDKAVIHHIEYTKTDRVITIIGVKTDVFKKRGVREYRHLTKIESLTLPATQKRGRPKGVKNGHGKKKPKKKKQKRGRKGLFEVFTKGKKGYMKVNPYRKTLTLNKGCLVPVAAGLNVAFMLFAGMSIQNNLAENINSVIKSILILRGKKTLESMENRLRVTLTIRNDRSKIKKVRINRHLRSEFLLNSLLIQELGGLIGRGWELASIEKKE